MKTIPTVELMVAVPSDVVATFLRERPTDPRVASAAKLPQCDSGNSTQKVTVVDDLTIEEAMMRNDWFGETHVNYR